MDERRVFVAGHRGLVGSAIVRRLEAAGTRPLTASRAELDLRSQLDVERWFADARPTHVYLAAAKVGGIVANDSSPADFIRDNLLIQTLVIDAALRHGCEKLLFLGSSCIYPREAAQPMREDALLSGPLEPTNQWYAIAKIAGVKMCQAYRRQHGFDAISVMPTNLYGPGDEFDLERSHVVPALLRKVHEAKRDGRDEVVVWGSGTPRRELLYVDDCADACVFLMQRYGGEEIINVGVGEDVSILELAEVVRDVVGWSGGFVLDRSKPDGTPRKLLDVSRARALGWQAKTGLREGLARTYAWFLANHERARGVSRASDA